MDNIANATGKIVVISQSEGFLVKGLLSKFEEKGMSAEFVGSDLKAIDSLKDETELYILFADAEIAKETECFVFLKDIATDIDRKIIVIGDEEQVDFAAGILPETLILNRFFRPLDMEKLLKCIEHYMESSTGENRKKSILIVDDDITYMRLIYDWLSPYYHIGMAASGVQAIKYLAKNKADLVLLDYEMPVVNGPQVLEMLRGDADSGSIPVMFLTGKGDKDSVLSVVSLQPVDYLLKTIDKDTLKKKIDTFFAKGSTV